MNIALRFFKYYWSKHIALSLLALVLFCITSDLHAIMINYDDQGLIGPSYISGTPYDSPEVVEVSAPALGGDVTFENGRIFTNASGVYANNTSIYANIDYGNYSSNIITIILPTIVSNYSLEIINAVPFDIEYQVRDNGGNSHNVTIIPNSLHSNEILEITGNNISIIEVEAITNAVDLGYSRSWAYGIDNLTINETIVIPESASMILIGSGLMGL